MPTSKATSGKAKKKLEKRAKKREQEGITAPQEEVAAPAATPAASDGSAHAPGTQQHDASDRVNSVCKRLRAFAQKTVKVMVRELESWAVRNELSDDFAALVALAEGGSLNAQLVLGFGSDLSEEEKMSWVDRAVSQGDVDAYLLFAFGVIAGCDVSTLATHKKGVLRSLSLPLEEGVSMEAQYAAGMLHYILDCDSGSREDYLVAARLIRTAAMSRIQEAQYELGEMFRLGFLCDGRNMMLFARRYIRRAARSGHEDAVARMRELRSCALCGADDAPWECALCRQVRYCDYATCCVKHWREGGGVGGGISGGGAGERHKVVCLRMHEKKQK